MHHTPGVGSSMYNKNMSIALRLGVNDWLTGTGHIESDSLFLRV